MGNSLPCQRISHLVSSSSDSINSLVALVNNYQTFQRWYPSSSSSFSSTSSTPPPAPLPPPPSPFASFSLPIAPLCFNPALLRRVEFFLCFLIYVTSSPSLFIWDILFIYIYIYNMKKWLNKQTKTSDDWKLIRFQVPPALQCCTQVNCII